MFDDNAGDAAHPVLEKVLSLGRANQHHMQGLADAADREQELVHQNEALKSQLEQLRPQAERSEALQQACDAAGEALAVSRTSEDALRQQVESQQAELDELAAGNRQLRESKARVGATRLRLLQRLGASEAEVDPLKVEVGRLCDSVDALVEGSAQRGAALTLRDDRIARLQHDLAVQEAAAAELRARVQQQEVEAKKQAATISTLFRDLERDSEAARVRLMKAQEALAAAQANAQEVVAAVHADAQAAVAAAKANARAANAAARQDLAAAREAHSQLQDT